MTEPITDEDLERWEKAAHQLRVHYAGTEDPDSMIVIIGRLTGEVRRQRGLIKRYMSGVAEAEGVYFISDNWTEAPGKATRHYPRTTHEDDQELCRFAEEISAYCKGQRDD